MAQLSDGYEATIIDPRASTDDEIAERVVYGNLMQAEVFPDEAPTPVEVAIASIRATPARYALWTTVYRDAEGRLAGTMGVGKDWDHDDNPDVGGLNVAVHPDHRGKGLAKAMIAQRVAFARALGETRFFSGTNDRRPEGKALAESLGAVKKTEMHVNQLLVADTDRAMLEGWVTDAETRSADYELLLIDGRIPDDLAEAYIDLSLVMNTAPRDDLEVNDFTYTIEQLREGEEQAAAVGSEDWTAIVRHRETGELAGFHDLHWGPWDPTKVGVGATGVRPEHRGHALGKWLKASLMLRVLDERPLVDAVRTGNADSNDAMLGINHAMGYKPWLGTATWETTLDQVEAWLTSRGVEIPDVAHLVVKPEAEPA